MKICVEPSLFADLIGRAARHTSSHAADPILSGLLLEAGRDTVTVSALNRGTSIKATIPAEVAEPGHTLLPGRVLAEAVKTLAKRREMLELAATEHETTGTCGASIFTIRAIPAANFPALPEPAKAVGAIDATDLRDAVTQVAPVCKPDKPAKPEHAVVRIAINGDTITWVGADNYRMAARATEWQPANTGAVPAIHVPVRELRDVARDFTAGTVTLGSDGNVLSLADTQQTVTVRQYQVEEYVNYEPRLAAQLPTTVTVDTAALLDAVKRVTLFADETHDVTLDIGDTAIGVHAGDISLIGRGADSVDCHLDGDRMTLRFQPQYLLDGLEGIHTEKTVIGLTAPGRYITLTSTDELFKYLTIPLSSS